MKLKLKILLLILSFQPIILIGQEMQSVRYKVTSNGLLNMMKDYPEKKESIEKNMTSNTPKHIDFVLIDDELIEVFWGYQNNLMGIKIYSKGKLYAISVKNEFVIENQNQNTQTDTIQYKRIETKNDAIIKYELTEEGAMPLTVTLNDTLENDNFSHQASLNDYPEISIITDFKIFPKKYVFGKPKAYMTFDFLKKLEPKLFKSKKDYLEFMANIDSKEKRQLLLEKIVK